jgi:parvulin-like peptidyl-prolyl isomerase
MKSTDCKIAIPARGVRALALAASLVALVPAGHAQDAPGITLPETVFARVNGVDIPAAEFDHEARESFRRKYYHGKPPEEELDRMMRLVGQKLVDQRLLDAEVLIRKPVISDAAVQTEVDQIDARNAKDPEWAARRAEILPQIRRQIESRHRLKSLESAIRSVKADPAATRAFYDKRPELFTEPTRNDVSIIMLPVDAASTADAWEARRVEGLALVERIRKGEDFAALAKEHSKGPSAEAGGRLGFVHAGTLAPAVEEELTKMKPGDLAGPILTLEGQSIVRLEARQPPALRPFDAVEQRAKELYLREQAETNWRQFLEGLRAKARVEIGPAFARIMSLPLPADAGPPGLTR